MSLTSEWINKTMVHPNNRIFSTKRNKLSSLEDMQDP